MLLEVKGEARALEPAEGRARVEDKSQGGRGKGARKDRMRGRHRRDLEKD